MKNPLLLLVLALLTGCASGPMIDHSYSAKSQSSRVKYIVLHYTVSDLPGSVRILTQGEVSSAPGQPCRREQLENLYPPQ